MSDQNNPTSTIHCTGWWEQKSYGRQTMNELVLAFHGMNFQGSGTDIVGPFTLIGQIDTVGKVTIAKQYAGKHNVRYAGDYDGEGTMSGLWYLQSDVGHWLIHLRAGAFDKDAVEINVS